jgi:hypothetical protein
MLEKTHVKAMNKIIAIACMLPLLGCAAPTVAGLAQRDCQHDAYMKYGESQDSVAAVLGGALAGPLGSTVMGATTHSGFSSSDINPYIEHCMAAKGYIGFSEN